MTSDIQISYVDFKKEVCKEQSQIAKSKERVEQDDWLFLKS